MAARPRDWLKQAERDLIHARHSLAAETYEWACFACQQAAEKAVKAVHQHLGVDSWGHTVSALLEALPAEAAVPPDLIDAARELDRHYIRPAIRTRIPKERLTSSTRGPTRSEQFTMQSRSSGTVRLFWLDRAQVLARLTAAIERMVSEYPEVDQVVLFGSLARGDALPGSDADLLVLLQQC